MKPSVYLDANVISSTYYRGGSELGRTRASIMQDWWDLEARHFEIWTSNVARKELEDGQYNGQAAAVAAAKRIRRLPLTGRIKTLATVLVESDVIPASKVGDAFHLAISIAHEMDYLMTWNYAHLVNEQMKEKLKEIASHRGWRTPIIVSPEVCQKSAWGNQSGGVMKRFDERDENLARCLRARRKLERKYKTIDAFWEFLVELERESNAQSGRKGVSKRVRKRTVNSGRGNARVRSDVKRAG